MKGWQSGTQTLSVGSSSVSALAKLNVPQTISRVSPWTTKFLGCRRFHRVSGNSAAITKRGRQNPFGESPVAPPHRVPGVLRLDLLWWTPFPSGSPVAILRYSWNVQISPVPAPQSASVKHGVLLPGAGRQRPYASENSGTPSGHIRVQDQSLALESRKAYLELVVAVFICEQNVNSAGLARTFRPGIPSSGLPSQVPPVYDAPAGFGEQIGSQPAFAPVSPFQNKSHPEPSGHSPFEKQKAP